MLGINQTPVSEWKPMALQRGGPCSTDISYILERTEAAVRQIITVWSHSQRSVPSDCRSCYMSKF